MRPRSFGVPARVRYVPSNAPAVSPTCLCEDATIIVNDSPLIGNDRYRKMCYRHVLLTWDSTIGSISDVTVVRLFSWGEDSRILSNPAELVGGCAILNNTTPKNPEEVLWWYNVSAGDVSAWIAGMSSPPAASSGSYRVALLFDCWRHEYCIFDPVGGITHTGAWHCAGVDDDSHLELKQICYKQLS